MAESRPHEHPQLKKEWKDIFQGASKVANKQEKAEDTCKNKRNENNTRRSSLITQWFTHPATKTELPSNLPKTDNDEGNHEEISYFTGKTWWIQSHDIPSSEKCILKNCTFEPTAHQSHLDPVKFLHVTEKKILLKYLIMRNCIDKAKGIKIYNEMIKDGYLSHRTCETLRNCFCKTILLEIEKYELDEGILAEFLKLRKK